MQASPALTSVSRSGNSSLRKQTQERGRNRRHIHPLGLEKPRQIRPGKQLSREPITSVAPETSAVKISETEASKLKEANCRTRLCRDPESLTLGLRQIGQPPVGNHDPLGAAVEPEV